MVLVDTSIWIRFLSGRGAEIAEMRAFLQRDEVLGHELVYGELLIGDRGGRASFLSDYALMTQAPSIPHDEVVAFVKARRLHGRGIGWIDVHLLAAAVVARAKLWTADSSLAAVANELGVT